MVALMCTLAVSASSSHEGPKVIDLEGLPRFDTVLPALLRERVVFVGETHTRYDHHLNQLEVIRQLHARDPRIAVGVEFFQQPFQRHVDDYIAGEIDERELLLRTEYYERWRFDFRLYAPILAFARVQRIPVIALNIPSEITRKVGRSGLASLSVDERAWVPEMDAADAVYRERLRAVFEQHPHARGSGGDFDNFVAAQRLWDEGMAQRAAEYLKLEPKRRLVILAGSGHVVRPGLPRGLARRGYGGVVILNAGDPVEAGLADFVLVSQARQLPPGGALGVLLEPAARGAEVVGVSPNSAAQAAGLRAGDRILSIDRQPVRTAADTKAMLWDKRRGESVQVELARGDATLTLPITLR